MLTDVTGLSAGAVSLVILLYGASVAAGNILGGKLADRIGPIPSLTLIFTGLAALLAAFGLALSSTLGAIVVVALWGGFAFANVPPLQAYTVTTARQVAPGAVAVASGLNIGAFNLGIAFGSWGGGHIVEQMGLAATPFVAAVVVASGIVLTRLAARLDTAPSAAVPAE